MLPYCPEQLELLQFVTTPKSSGSNYIMCVFLIFRALANLGAAVVKKDDPSTVLKAKSDEYHNLFDRAIKDCIFKKPDPFVVDATLPNCHINFYMNIDCPFVLELLKLDPLTIADSAQCGPRFVSELKKKV